MLAAAGLLLPSLSMQALTLARYASHSAGTEGEALAAGGVVAAGAGVVGAGVVAGGVDAGGVAVGAGVVEAAGGAAFSSLLLQPANTPTDAASAKMPIILR